MGTASSLRIKIATVIALWFGAGKSPSAPGTVGSLAALPFIWGVYRLWYFPGLIIFTTLIFFTGWWASRIYMRHIGRHGDPKEIVVDEVAGMSLTVLLFGFIIGGVWPPIYIAAFIVFRFFDILKPWPISWVDRRFKNAFGVMMDDILAAMYLPFVITLFVLFI